jgi:hypothetical protein
MGAPRHFVYFINAEIREPFDQFLPMEIAIRPQLSQFWIKGFTLTVIDGRS